ncbi:hypothetical protein M569_17442, partial [Genlisea aurea]
FLFLNSPPRSKKSPPSPPRLPIIGNLHQLGSLPHRSLQSLSNRYGSLMLLRIGSFPVLVASSANAAREIMKNQDLIFSNRPYLSIANKLFYGGRDVAFSSYGDYWRHVRSICVLHLLSNKKVQSFRKVREEETSNMIEKIRESGSSAVNLSSTIVSLTNAVVTRAALGRKYDEHDEQGNVLRKLLIELSQIVGNVNIADFIPWLGWINSVNGVNSRAEEIRKGLDEFLDAFIRERRQKTSKMMKQEEEEASNFIDMLLEFQNENKDNSPVDDDAIKAIILDVFSGGTDTTSTALGWTMAELIKNPRVMKTLRDELGSVVGHGEITEAHLDGTPYLKAVVKETFRLHPPVPLLVPRESTRGTSVDGYEIPAGTRVMINAWAIGNDPSVWEDPLRFRPERFLEGDAKSVDFRGLNFELIPFGAGRRGCPGITFAASVLELAVAKLVYHFEFELAGGDGGGEMDMSEASGVTVHRRIPLVVV